MGKIKNFLLFWPLSLWEGILGMIEVAQMSLFIIPILLIALAMTTLPFTHVLVNKLQIEATIWHYSIPPLVLFAVITWIVGAVAAYRRLKRRNTRRQH